MFLEYIRLADHVEGSAIPLPEGWPAIDHWEGDIKLAHEKIDSGRYRKVDRLAAQEGEQPTRNPHNDYGKPENAPADPEPPATPAAAPTAPPAKEPSPSSAGPDKE